MRLVELQETDRKAMQRAGRRVFCIRRGFSGVEAT
jgi:hypothetical protein